MNYIKQQAIQMVDANTGEVKEVAFSVSEKTIKNQEPPYVKLYLNDLKYIYGIDGGDMNLLISLVKYMDYNNIVDLGPRIKSELMEALGWKHKASLNTALHRLKKASALFSVARGSYKVNPYMFAKGGWGNVVKIRTTIEYSPKGRTVTHDFENESNTDTND